jgi:uncharacterized protein
MDEVAGAEHGNKVNTNARKRRLLIVPGIYNSGYDHWQSHWERNAPEARRVEQSDWVSPTLGEWTAGLAEAVRSNPDSILVAHSLGCAVVAHLSHISAGRGIACAFLAAPADVNRSGAIGKRLEGFSPLPELPLPFPSVVVASRNDPHMAFDRAKTLAASWRARLVDLGAAGHINVASGFGPWPEGRAMLEEMIAEVGSGSAVDGL